MTLTPFHYFFLTYNDFLPVENLSRHIFLCRWSFSASLTSSSALWLCCAASIHPPPSPLSLKSLHLALSTPLPPSLSSPTSRQSYLFMPRLWLTLHCLCPQKFMCHRCGSQVLLLGRISSLFFMVDMWDARSTEEIKIGIQKSIMNAGRVRHALSWKVQWVFSIAFTKRMQNIRGCKLALTSSTTCFRSLTEKMWPFRNVLRVCNLKALDFLFCCFISCLLYRA